MYKIEAHITGIAPLRFNRYIPATKENAGKKKMTHDQQKEDALTRAYRDDKGFYIPKEALRACIINGGKKVKIGRGAASKLMEAILVFDDDKYYLGNNDFKIQEDVVRIPPKTGARIMQMWAVLPSWGIKFTATILDSTFPSDGVKESIEFAGMYYGLLDGRPQLGRFELTSFKKIKE